MDNVRRQILLEATGRDITKVNYRNDIVKEALEWVGTPYKHYHGVKGIATDCGLFIMRVYANCGLCTFEQPEFYPTDWAWHSPTGEWFKNIVLDSCHQVSKEEVGIGDIILYKFGKTLSHGAILMENDMIIHSELGIGVTVSNRYANTWSKREREYFSYGR
jgi:cell wall-associated NlpC family hydrolase